MREKNSGVVVIRGGGDLASGVALRLHRVGMRLLVTELDQPLVIRRSVSFAEAVYTGSMQVEEVSARLVKSIDGIASIWENGEVPVIVDPECQVLSKIHKTQFEIKVLVDGRMTKKPADLMLGSAPLMIGLGPGFVVGQNCNAVVETKRGHYLGRVLLTGSASQDTGVPEGFGNQYQDRVLRSPAEGVFQSNREIGDQLNPGDLIGEVDGEEIYATFKGVLRGLLHPGLFVTKGFKVGDLDPRNDPEYCKFVSDKALAVAGGVLEAILVKDQSLVKREGNFKSQ